MKRNKLAVHRVFFVDVSLFFILAAPVFKLLVINNTLIVLTFMHFSKFLMQYLEFQFFLANSLNIYAAPFKRLSFLK